MSNTCTIADVRKKPSILVNQEIDYVITDISKEHNVIWAIKVFRTKENSVLGFRYLRTSTMMRAQRIGRKLRPDLMFNEDMEFFVYDKIMYVLSPGYLGILITFFYTEPYICLCQNKKETNEFLLSFGISPEPFYDEMEKLNDKKNFY